MIGQRTLSAIVFTDAVAFSTRVGQNEEVALGEIQGDFDQMREVCTANGGRVLKSMGDGLLMAFDSASQAVDTAIEIQRRFAERGPGALRHRMGVHLCDVILEENDAHGEGVNLAARLEAEASPGGICLSQTIYDIVKSRLPVQAKFLGERRLKNLVEPVKVFEIGPGNAPRGQRIPPPMPKARTGWSTAAALCFVGASILTVAAVLWSQGSSSDRQVAPLVVERDRPGPTKIVERTVPGPTRTITRPAPSGAASTQPPVPTPAQAAATDFSHVSQMIAELKRLPSAMRPMRERAATRAFLKIYDFDGLLSWLQAKADVPPSQEQQDEIDRISSVKELYSHLEEDVSMRSEDHPLTAEAVGFRTRAGSLKVWSADGKIILQQGDTPPREGKLSELGPLQIRLLLASSAQEGDHLDQIRPVLRTFDSTYAWAYTPPPVAAFRNQRPGTTAKIDVP